VRIVCLSDTHGLARDVPVPDGDVLVHAGDLSQRGTLTGIGRETEWLRSLPHPHKVVIAGNHDFAFQREAAAALALCEGLVYLEDEEAVVAGLRVYGSPWQPVFFDWAFNLPRGAPLRAKWDRIPAGLDLLVTHGPPRGIGDRTTAGHEVGCDDLLAAVARARPRLHVFGHIHEGRGRTDRDGTIHVNASLCSADYRTLSDPIVVDLPDRGA
jgi:Icc-related predicted phosphoesterase